MKKKITIHLLMSLFFVMIAVQAHAAVTLTPTTNDWSGYANGVPAIFAEWNALLEAEGSTLTVGNDTELYKKDVGVLDVGQYKDSYNTLFFPVGESDPSYARTWHVSGTDVITTSPTYLLVKGGAQNVTWYGYDLSAWDGLETIEMNNFWLHQGSISHIAIYGDDNGQEVPEPATMLIFGAGLVGLAGYRSRMKKR